MASSHHAGMGWSNGPADREALAALPTDTFLMLSPEARYHHDWLKQRRPDARILWRAIPRIGKRPAELSWSPGRFVDEALNLTDEARSPITDFIPWNELDLNSERGDNADDFAEHEARYRLIGGWAYSVVELLRVRLPGARIHWPAWTPDHFATGNFAPLWRPAALRCSVVDFHAYDSLERVRLQYTLYRQLFPNHPLALTEWHCKGDLDEERRVLAWLAATMQTDPLFEAACFFIWRWHQSPGWWDDRWDVEHSPDRYALFKNPPAAPEAPVMPDYRAMTRDAAAAAGIDPGLFERQIDAESGYAEDVITCRRVSSAGAQGIAQLMARFHPDVNPCDPPAALAYAANLMAGHLDKYGGDWALGLSCYNAGPGATASGLKGQLAGWPYAETVRYVSIILQIPEAEAARRLSGQKGAPVPARVTFNRDQPAFAQNDDWSCAPTATRWALWAVGRQPSEQWIEDTMVAEGVVSHELGLLDATGAGLAAFVKRQYGEFGYDSNSEPDVSFAAVAAEIGPYPLLVGGRAWNHWSGVRGYDASQDVLLLANPGDGWQGVGQTLSRSQWDSLGPWSMVRVLHPDLLTPAPAPAPPPPPVPPPPVPPPPDPKARAAALLREAIAILEGS